MWLGVHRFRRGKGNEWKFRDLGAPFFHNQNNDQAWHRDQAHSFAMVTSKWPVYWMDFSRFPGHDCIDNVVVVVPPIGGLPGPPYHRFYELYLQNIVNHNTSIESSWANHLRWGNVGLSQVEGVIIIIFSGWDRPQYFSFGVVLGLQEDMCHLSLCLSDIIS